jgi:hypothetical protein
MVDKKYIKCECDTNTTGIETLDLEHLSGENIGNSFLTTLQSTNWKVMICYNLVFNFKIFVHNYGSIFILILFVVYIIFMIYFCFKEINPLKVEISKMIFEDTNEEKETKLISNYYKKSNIKEKLKNKKINYPPKKEKTRTKTENAHYENKNIKTEEKNLIMRKRKVTNKSTKQGSRRYKSSRKALINKVSKEVQINTEYKNKNKKIEKDDEKNKKIKTLDNFELNNLDYYDACELDKRTCLRTYWSVLMREHSALITFLARNDYNLFYIKIERFLILFCVDMTMSGLFFVHETMHRKYTQREDFTFVQKIPQLLFTLIVAHVLEVILCFLSLTDTHIYEIKSLSYKNNKENHEKIMDILSCIKRKLTAFLIFTFLLFLFFWYFISAFCAVYQNTQKIFLRDSMISFAISMIDPFFIYSLTCLLRCISLTKLCRKKCCGGCLFKTSDIIPIF